MKQLTNHLQNLQYTCYVIINIIVTRFEKTTQQVKYIKLYYILLLHIIDILIHYQSTVIE